MTFVEATVEYTTLQGDKRQERRLFNLAEVWMITAAKNEAPLCVFHMRGDHEPPFFVVYGEFDYWSAVLTANQLRRVS